jgi:hypothetical protein
MNEGLKTSCIAEIFLLMIATTASTQEKVPNDRVRQMIARNEEKHLRSRQNLIKILREQPTFWIELQAIAKRLKTEPAWLLNVMASESLFDHTARNGISGQTATGLLQFIESTAKKMGTTTQAIRRMSPVEQLRLVERYLMPFRGYQRIHSLNRWLDFDGDGKITKGELALAALAIGRFQPTTPLSGGSLYRKPAEAADRKSETPQTRSIYMR